MNKILESSCHRLLSAGLGESLELDKIALDEPQAFMEVVRSGSSNEQLDDISMDSDDESTDDLYGFPRSDQTMLLTMNRILDLSTSLRYRSKEFNWTADRSRLSTHKRLYDTMASSNTFAGYTNHTATDQSVPKRRRY